MTKLEALHILVRYMPERSIHITEHLDSCYFNGDRTDKLTAFVTISPGITKAEPECFIAESIETATQRAMDATHAMSPVAIREVLTVEGWKPDRIIGTAGEDLRSGQVVEIGNDGLMRAAQFNAEQSRAFEILNAQ